jgi:hypothetical protein
MKIEMTKRSVAVWNAMEDETRNQAIAGMRSVGGDWAVTCLAESNDAFLTFCCEGTNTSGRVLEPSRRMPAQHAPDWMRSAVSAAVSVEGGNEAAVFYL